MSLAGLRLARSIVGRSGVPVHRPAVSLAGALDPFVDYKDLEHVVHSDENVLDIRLAAEGAASCAGAG